MMIVMKPTATEEEIQAVIERIEAVGARAHPSRGEEVTVIGAIGDREHVARLGLEGAPGVEQRRADPQAVQARVGAAQAGEAERGRDRRAPDRRRALRADRRAVHGRVARPDADDGAHRGEAGGATMFRGGAYKPRTSPYAFQGLGHEGLRLLAEAKARDRPADRHRADGRARPRARARGRRRHPDRRAQHAELPAAGRDRPLRLPGADQARAVRDARGAADGGRVHPQGGQPERDAVRARHPHVRDRLPLHARPDRRAGAQGAHAPAGDRRPEPRRRPARRWSSRCRWPRPPSAPTGSSSRCTRSPRRRSATARRRCTPTASPSTPRRSSARPRSPARRFGRRLRAPRRDRRGRRRRADRRLDRARRARAARAPRCAASTPRRACSTRRSRAARSTPRAPRPPRRSRAPTAAFVAAPVRRAARRVREALAARRPGLRGDRRRLDQARGRRRGRRPALHRRPPARRRRDGRRRARARRAVRRRHLVPDADRATTEGMLYERLHRLLADLGARPPAIDAETHDRLMAAVSHLPHVLANVLVAQAARRARRSASGCPRPARASATPRASRAPRPRSGATSTSPTPTRWSQRSTTRVARLGDGPRGAGRRATRRPSAAWNDGAARGPPAAARGRPRGRRRWPSCASSVPNRPGVVAEVALALGRGTSTSSTWRCTRRPTTRPARSRCGSPARSDAREAERPDRGARPPGGARVSRVLRPRAPRPARHAHRAARQVDLAPRRAAGRDERPSRCRVTQLPRRRGHASTLRAVQALGALVEERDDELVIRGPGLRGAPRSRRRDRRRQRRHADAPAARLAGRAARRRAWTLDGDASIRRRPVDRIAEPLRRDGRAASRRARTASRRSRRAAAALTGIEYELPVASAQVKSCVLLAGLLADGATTRDRAGAEPRPHRAACSLRGRRRASSASGTRVTVGPQRRARARRDPRARRPVVGGVPRRRRGARAGLADRASRASAANWTRVGFFRIAAADGRRRRRPARGAAGGRLPGDEPVCELDVTARAAGRHGRRGATRCRWRSTSCRSSRCSAASPRARPSCAARRSCASRSPTGSPPSSTACAASARTSRRPRTASSCTGTGGLRGGVIDAHGDHRLAMLGAVAGLASREGVEVVGMEARRRLLSGLRRRPRGAARPRPEARPHRLGGAGRGSSPRRVARGVAVSALAAHVRPW